MFCMQMSPILDYKNILMSENMKMAGNSKKLMDKTKKGAQFWPGIREFANVFYPVGWDLTANFQN